MIKFAQFHNSLSHSHNVIEKYVLNNHFNDYDEHASQQ